jgi:uncharacterized membrane protein YbhN (UPF0104 family)
MGCNILDRLSVLPLVALALYGMRLPGWLRLLLLGTLIQSAFFLLVPLIATITRSRLGRYAPRSGWGRKLRAALADVEHGLATLVAGGWRLALSAIALSFLITAGSILRLSLLLGAFELSASPHQLMLLLVMSGLMGSLPVTLPGAEAWATGKLLRLVRVLGPGAGGFVLLSNVIAVLETPLLAAGILLWWALPRSDVSLRLGELLALARQPGADHPPVGDAA